MTSKVSFFDWMRENAKRRIWTFVLAFLVFFLALPVLMLLLYTGIPFDAYLEWNPDKTLLMLKREFFLLTFQRGINAILLVVSAVGACICGVSGFSYLFSKKKVDFYHGIPMKRTELFAVNYVNGLLIYLLPYLFNLILCYVIAVSQVGWYGSLLGKMGIAFLITFLYFLLFYHLSILAVVLAGNMINALILLVVFGGYFIALYGITWIYQQEFFDTFLPTRGNELNLALTLSPFALLFEEFERMIESIVKSSISLEYLKVFVLSGLLLVLSCWLYKKRPSEAAERAIAYPKLIIILRPLLVIFSALAGGIFFYFLGDERFGWMLFGTIFSALFAHCMLNILYSMGIHGIFQGKGSFAVTCVCSVLLSISFFADWWRYDSYLPKKENLTSMSIEISGINGNNGWYEYSDMEVFTVIKNKNQNLDYNSPLDYMEITDIEALYELAKLGVNPEKSDPTLNIKLCYRLKNGNAQYRSYQVSAEEAKPFIIKVYDDVKFKQATYQILSLLPEQIKTVDVNSCYYTDRKKIQSPSKIEALLEAYQEDKYQMEFEEEIREAPCSVLDFRTEYQEYTGYVYPSFTKTLSLLEEMGFSEDYWSNTLDPKKIKSITINGYVDKKYLEPGAIEESQEETEAITKYGRKDGELITIVYTEPEKIEELCAYLMSGHCINRNFMYVFENDKVEIRDRYNISAEYESEYGTQYIDLIPRQKELPEFIQEDLIRSVKESVETVE